MQTVNSNDVVYNSYQIDLSVLFHRLFELITGSPITADTIIALIGTLWFYFSILSFIVSAAFIYGIIYSFLRIAEYNEAISERLSNEHERWVERYSTHQADRRWHEIKQHVASSNPNDWKLAIIEADIILGEILTKAGYAGLTIGDRLKSAPPSQFQTLQDAWDAHRIRNRVAHEGADFVLTQNAAREAIVKYERVFSEFKHIHGV